MVATDGPAGMALYVDAVRVGFNAAPGSPGATAGFWRWAGDTLSGWPAAPTSDYLYGDLEEIATYSVQLTSTQVSAHYSAST